jgi:basic membrane protein A
MSKRIAVVLAALLTLSSLLTGCGLLGLGDAPAAEAPAMAPSDASTVCLVTDTQGINDRSFNATAWRGVTNAQEQLGIASAYLESIDDTYYDINIQAFLQGGCDLIVSVGWLIGNATATAAEANPERAFTIVDYDFVDFSVDPPADVVYPNVRELTFQSDQGAFLAGYVAAGVTQSGKVGTYGGLEIPTVTIFMDGFTMGVAHYNQVHGTDVSVVGWDPVLRIGFFTETFDDVQAGAAFGETLIAEGVDIILPVAGGVGLGTAAVAQERDGVYIIGVDTDWTVSSPEYAGIILTSVLKNMDVAVFDTIQAFLNGNFQGGLYVGTLANDGIGLASFNELDALVSDELKAELEQVKADIIAGTIATSPE